MELEKLNLYRDTSWNDIKLRFCGHSECLPLHSYGPGTRPYYLMHFVLSGKGLLVVNKTEYLIEEKQIFLIEDIYYFEEQLAILHPRNHNIKAKIRQQLQVLRDKGFLEFIHNGVYKKI